MEVYDSFSKTIFNLKALLMWTINDFPAYGNLSRCTYKGKATCPLCGDNTISNWLSFSRKTVYMNHRKIPAYKHHPRSSKKKACFNGDIERKEKPPIMSGAMDFERHSSIVNDFGKAEQNEMEKRKEKEENKKNKKNKQKKGQSRATTGANEDNSKCGKRKKGSSY